ncbi:hypothetical protein [Ornithinimicrobium pratense]|uniref:hypothetical protein n=1 Tax=Ornithinimicrobium pratense TaxID=2593973 RepID=UPI001787F7B7|nr:hypothetical protein [Ornithinimicrobium pratense]
MNAARAPHTLDEARLEAVSRARARWRHEVADLGGPNTLLWHRTSLTGTFDLNLAHPGGVAKLLSGRPTPLSDLVREQVAFTDAARRIGGIRDKIAELRREHGIEAGFLAIGLATWDLHRVLVPPRAPVLLRACTITPTDPAHSDFVLQLHEDVVFNPVLEHYLRSEVHLQLNPEMLVGLSAQSHGFDPRLTYQALEDICGEMKGFAIGPQMVISTFPWAKLPLVTSYTGEVEPLAASDVVAALAGADVALPSSGPDPDRAEDPRLELSALDADRSQRLVIDEAVHGGSLVLDTPSGTGSTQTIANVVVGALSEGRRVLVCSEERSALEALQRRLQHVGLGDLCLHLAEDPVSMRATLEDARQALDRLSEEPEPDLGTDPLPGREDALAVLRREQEVLHREHEPWGLSLAGTQGDLAELAALDHPPASRVRLPRAVLGTLSQDRLSEVTDALIEAADAGAWSRSRTEDPWYAARLASADEAGRATEVVGRLVGGEFTAARAQAEQICKKAGMPVPVSLQQWAHRLGLIARASQTLDVFSPQIYDAPLDEMVAATTARNEVAERPGAVTRARMRRQVRQHLRPGTPPADLAHRVRLARDERDEWEQIAGKAARPNAPYEWERAVLAHTPIGEDLGWLAQVLEGTATGHELFTSHLDIVLERLVRLDARSDRAGVAAQAHPLLAPLREAGLGELVDDLARRGMPPERVAAEVRFVHRSSVLDHLTSDEVPQQVPGQAVREAERAFRAADRAHLRRNALRARRAVLRRLRRALTGHSSQVGAWQRALDEAKVGAVDARAIISRAPDIVLAARPVVLASPLAVPAALPADLTFDLVIVDRAGRTTTARTVPALAHGRQTMIVGDSGGPGPRQFSVVADPKAEREAAAEEAGGSLLDDAARVLPVRHLKVHYRALNQGLVAPLAALMPAPVYSFPGVDRGPAVREHVAEGGVAAQVSAGVALALEHARKHPRDSLLLVTDDDAGAEDVAIALRSAYAHEDWASPSAALADDERLIEPFLVRPAHRISGEVRDRVVWVTSPGGSAQAEVAGSVLAAARRSVDLVVPSSIEEWSARPGEGAALLAQALLPVGDDAAGDSAVLRELVRRLRAEGLEIVEEVGHGPHTVDVGVVSETEPRRFAVAVDGDVHAPTPGQVPGRDDVRLRHEQLIRMGWTPVRVRSTDVFTDPAREVARVLAALRERGPARP